MGVDVLRGAVIVLMALDHARDYVGFTAYDPTDFNHTTPALFITRWITHFCAPVFFFLAGVSVALSGSSSKPTPTLARTLLTRGVWLILLEFTLVRWGWFVGFAADWRYSFAIAQVIWALGWSMIALAGALFLPRWLLFTLAIAIVGGHNALDSTDPASLGPLSGLWKVLHVSDLVHFSTPLSGHTIFIRYPLIPWPAVMAFGYLFAPVLTKVGMEPRRRARLCLTTGLTLTAAFILLRAVNAYGDPHPWNVQTTPLLTVLSFLNTEKYPPSLDYLLMTLGPAIAALPFLERLPGALRRILATFGQVPMFFYIAHLFTLQALAITTALCIDGLRILQAQGPPNYGLGAVYALWIVAVTILYFPCRWFARLKQRRRAWWHSYL